MGNDTKQGPGTQPGPWQQGTGEVTIIQQLQQAPGALIVSAGQFLRTRLWNLVPGAVATLSCRYVTAQGEKLAREVLTLTSDRLTNLSVTALPAGAIKILRLAISSGTVLQGQCFGIVEIVSDSGPTPLVLQVLLSGYITSQQGLSYPNSPIVTPGSGLGAPFAVAGTAVNFPFGPNPIYTVPANSAQQIVAVVLTFAAAVGGAARKPVLKMSFGGSNIVLSPAENTVAPGANALYAFSSRGYAHASVAGGPFNFEEYEPVTLHAADTITPFVDASAAGDAITNVTVAGVEWITP